MLPPAHDAAEVDAALRASCRNRDPVQEASLYIQDALAFTVHPHPQAGELPCRLHLAQLLGRPRPPTGLALIASPG